MTVDAYDGLMEIRNLFHKGGSLADLRLWYKQKERKGRSWERVEKITRGKYWSIH